MGDGSVISALYYFLSHSAPVLGGLGVPKNIPDDASKQSIIKMVLAIILLSFPTPELRKGQLLLFLFR